jgi:uncharacterized protein
MFGTTSEDELKRHLTGKYAEVTEDEAGELISDLRHLKSQGRLFTTDTFIDAGYKAPESKLKALCVNVSHFCNLSCAYCFTGGGSYGGDGELMSLDTGKRAIDFLVENSGGRKNLDVDFFGGEPLLNFGVCKEIVAYARSVEQRCGKKFRFTLTTNGMLIDDDVVSFSNREVHNVVLSLDGRPETNDASRRLSGEEGSYEHVVPKLKWLVEARRGKGYYIRGTYTRNNLDFVSDVLHIADLGFTELSMEPVVTKPGAPLGLTMDDLPALFREYELLAIEMLRRKKEGSGFSFYHFTLDLADGPCVHKRIAGCGVGTEYLAVTPRGELYPCHQFVGERSFLMGDVWRGITNDKLQGEFDDLSILTRAECRECWARYYCSGGCAANAYNASGSIGGVYEFGCELFKKRIECAIWLNINSNRG